ncbi:MAG: DUF1028 domain-containing protein [Marmoricola sp.]
MTFSLAARCARTGQFGVVISSSSPAVAARCAWVQSEIGAACTQNITDPRLGPALLAELADGASASAALDAVVRKASYSQHRQLSVVSAAGDVAVFSGAHTLGVHASATGEGAVACGNLLADPGVPAAMIAAFEADPEADLGDRLLAALAGALDAGGEAGPVHSTGLLIAEDQAWPLTDLRVDWHDDPVGQLQAAWAVWKPQAHEYVGRALNPAQSPSYGVPGDQ